MTPCVTPLADSNSLFRRLAAAQTRRSFSKSETRALAISLLISVLFEKLETVRAAKMNFIGRQIVKILKNEVANASYVRSLGRNYSFKSAVALENLYPDSSLKLYTPAFVPDEPNSKFTGFIPMEKLDVTYSRSSGPGGQHVNTVNTKVDLRFNIEQAAWLADEIKSKLMEQEKNQITKEGFLIIKSDLTRSQQLNLADALQRLRNMIRKAMAAEPAPNPETEEIMRKRHMRASRERLYVKRIRSQIKQGRSMSNHDRE